AVIERMKPSPCASSCRSTEGRSVVPVGPALSSPVYQEVTAQSELPTRELNWARISSLSGSRSDPARSLARAAGYRSLSYSSVGPVVPSTALLPEQSRLPKLARMEMDTRFPRLADQRAAAYCA